MRGLWQAPLLPELAEDLLELGKGLDGRLLAFEDRLIALLEVARTDVAHPGNDDHVGVPELGGRDLRVHDVDRLEDRVQDPLGKGAPDAGGDIYGDDDVGARFPCGIDGDGAHHAAVHVGLLPDPDRLEDSRDGAARPDRLPGIPRREDGLLTGLDVRGDRQEGDLQLFKGRLADRPVDEILQLLPADEAVVGDGPIDHIVLLEREGHLLELEGVNAVSVEASDEAPRTRPDDQVDRDLLGLENFEDADMGKPPGGAGPEDDGDLRRPRRRRRGGDCLRHAGNQEEQTQT
jgi:hypothetical protein